MDLVEITVPGLHRFLVESVVGRHAHRRAVALDLGSGEGALAQRLAAAGYRVEAVERQPGRYRAEPPVHEADLDDPSFVDLLPTADLVCAVEIIEHLENPIGFLRSVARLLAPDGIAVISTPNVDSIVARLKFLLTGQVKMMEPKCDPTHISPIFTDILLRQWMPRTGLQLVARYPFPADRMFSPTTTNPTVARLLNVAGRLVPLRGLLRGDVNVFVFRLASRRADGIHPDA